MAGLQRPRLAVPGMLSLLLASASGTALDPGGLHDAWALLSVGRPPSAFGDQRAAEAAEAVRPGASSLLGVSTAARGGRGNRGPREASWFGSVGDAEVPTIGVDWRLRRKHDIVPVRFFHESASGGPDEAWQTHYPAVGANLQNPRTDDSQARSRRLWKPQGEGWAIERGPGRPQRDDGGRQGPPEASWFDAAAGGLDAFGRGVPPPEGSVRRLLGEQGGGAWAERSVNTTITCPEQGCTGRSMLQAFDGKTEEAVNCRLNIAVFPTDFDNALSRESVEYWHVNGYVVRSHCSVGISGCEDERRPLLPCLREFNIDHLLDKTSGSMLIEGKLSKMVDECPYEGNLLSSVAQVTCLVRPKARTETTATTTTTLAGTGPKLPQEVLDTCRRSAVALRCREPGCTAEAVLPVDPVMAHFGATFKMNITLVVTDFDQSESAEAVEFVSLEGRGVLARRRAPRKSKFPCRAGESTQAGPRETFQIVEDLDVTKDVMKGRPFRIAAKISDSVDECASDGYLLDGVAEVFCTPPAEAAETAP